MNTTSHIILGLLPQTALGEKAGDKKCSILYGISGSLNPDLPMFVFFAVTAFVLRQDQSTIWGSTYYQKNWQTLFNSFNSIPLYAAGVLAALTLKKVRFLSFSLGGLLHCVLDLLLHHDDGHAHFWPFSEWVLVSPVSYWDPGHYGKIFAPFEFLLVLFFSVRLWKDARLPGRVMLIVFNLFNLASVFGTWFMFSGDTANIS